LRFTMRASSLLLLIGTPSIVQAQYPPGYIALSRIRLPFAMESNKCIRDSEQSLANPKTGKVLRANED